MGQYTRTSIKDVLINILLLIVLVLLLLVPAYLCYRVFIVGASPIQEEEIPEEVEIEEDIEEGGTQLEQGPHFEEISTLLDDQQAYIVVPTRIRSSNPATLVIYSHGSNTNVTQNMQDPFMQDLREYGIFLTQHNYIFAASNQHGVNWGNDASIRDTLNLKTYILENYNIKPTIYMIGFSMGGLPTMNFATQYPEMVSKIALLAPSTRTSEWNMTRAQKVKDIDIKIWHGNADVNVPYSSVVKFVNSMKSWGKDIILITLEGKTHFDVDTEYMEDILEFFND